MILVTATRHDAVSNDCVTSMCIALVVRQVMRQHLLLKVRRSNLTSKGPKYSTPAWVNGNTCSSSRSRGRSVIGGWMGLAFLCLHLIQFDLIFLNAFRNPIIQNSCWRMFLTYSVPSCWLSRCAFSNRSCTTGCFAVDNIGCFAF